MAKAKDILNAVPPIVWLAAVGTVVLIYFGNRAAGAVGSAISTGANALNPLNNNNVISQAASAGVQSATGGGALSLGDAAYQVRDWIHRNILGDSAGQELSTTTSLPIVAPYSSDPNVVGTAADPNNWLASTNPIAAANNANGSQWTTGGWISSLTQGPGYVPPTSAEGGTPTVLLTPQGQGVYPGNSGTSYASDNAANGNFGGQFVGLQ